MQNRIIYFDTLKGAAILYVVYNHLVWICMQERESISSALFESVCMNMFFLISGRLAMRQKSVRTKENAIQILFKKTYSLFFPALLWFAFSIYYWHLELVDSCLSEFKNGFWFTYVLFAVFFYEICLYLVINQLKISSKTRSIINIGLSVLLYIAGIIFYKEINCPQGNLLSLSLFLKYIIFFVIGFEYDFLHTMVSKIRSNHFLMLLIVIMFFVYPYQSACLQLIFNLCRVYLIFIIFKESGILNTDNTFSRILSWWGRNSLPIYFIHFFLLFNMTKISDIIHIFADSVCIKGNVGCQLVIEIVAILPIAIIIASLSCCLYIIMCKSKYLNLLLFGKESK